MAQVPYEGVPTVAPDARPPDDSQRIEANPNQFGGQIAQGLQQAGAGASKASLFFGQVQTDDAVNGALTTVNKSLNDFRALRGQDALNAQKPTQDTIDAAFKTGRDNLSTPEQQLQYDQATRAYQQRYVSGVMASHADQQAKEYANATNNASTKNALDGVTVVADDDAKVEAFKHDARAAAVRNVQLAGNENDPAAVKAAIQSADAAVYKTQAETIAVKDPVRALALVETRKAELGPYYYQLADQFRSRAAQQSGTDFVTKEALPKADARTAHANAAGPTSGSALPIFAQAAAANPGGFSANGLAKAFHIEGGDKPHAVNPDSGAEGPAQFLRSSWARFGNGGNPFNYADAAAATQRMAVANAPILARVLGRAPTDSELYLAHQQGAGGASKLLANPNVRAGDLVGDRAIRLNGGDPNAPASAFTSMWSLRFGGSGLATVIPGGGQAMQMPPGTQPAPATADAPPLDIPVAPVPTAPAAGALPDVPAPPATPHPAAPEAPPPVSAKADIYQQISNAEATGQLTHEAAQHAYAVANQQLAQRQIAEDQDNKARKAASDKALGGYVTTLLDGNLPPDFVHQIAHDPNLLPETKWTLGKAAEQAAGGPKDAKEYGSGFLDTMKAISAPADDPTRISDPNTIVQKYLNHELTLPGMEKAISIMERGRRSLDDQAVNRSKVGLLTYAKSQLSFEQDIGPIKIRDPKGEALFNSEFLPKFEASFDQQIKAGKDPWAFLTRKNVDEMIHGMRPKAQMDQERLAAMGEGTAGTEAPNAPLPAAPPAVDPKAWSSIVSTVPKTADEKPWTHAAWASVLERLVANPSPENIALFNASKFGKAGYDGAALVRQLSPRQAAGHRATTRAPAPPSAVDQVNELMTGAM